MVLLDNVIITGLHNGALWLVGISAGIIILYKVFTRWKDNTESIKQSAKVDGIVLLLTELKEEVSFIKKEVQFNGGTSVKDATFKASKQLDRIEAEIAFGKAAIRVAIIDQYYWFSDADGKTTEVSPKVCELLNKKEEQLLELGWTNYIHRDDIRRVINAFKEAQELGKDFNEDYRVNIGKNSNRNYITINASAKRIYSQGRFIGYHGTITKLD